MKIILSRKGFDSSAGGYPSIITPDNKLISLPIPDKDSIVKYSEMNCWNERNYYDVMNELKGSIKVDNQWVPITQDTLCHLDPDICQNIRNRTNGWRGAFGQRHIAQQHLERMKVGVGDLFIFFGWYRQTCYDKNKLVFSKSDKDGRHVIFGYLQVGQILKVDENCILPEWLNEHPHSTKSRRDSDTNTIYIANETLTWDDKLPGFGTFNYDDSLVLTKPGHSRSKWKLPDFFRNVDISHHDKDSWKDEGYFQSVGRGQEFVIEANEDIIKWAKLLIQTNIR